MGSQSTNDNATEVNELAVNQSKGAHQQHPLLRSFIRGVQPSKPISSPSQEVMESLKQPIRHHRSLGSHELLIIQCFVDLRSFVF